MPGTTKRTHFDERIGVRDARLSAEECAAFDNALTQITLVGHRASDAIESRIDK